MRESRLYRDSKNRQSKFTFSESRNEHDTAQNSIFFFGVKLSSDIQIFFTPYTAERAQIPAKMSHMCEVCWWWWHTSWSRIAGLMSLSATPFESQFIEPTLWKFSILSLPVSNGLTDRIVNLIKTNNKNRRNSLLLSISAENFQSILRRTWRWCEWRHSPKSRVGEMCLSFVRSHCCCRVSGFDALVAVYGLTWFLSLFNLRCCSVSCTTGSLLAKSLNSSLTCLFRLQQKKSKKSSIRHCVWVGMFRVEFSISHKTYSCRTGKEHTRNREKKGKTKTSTRHKNEN